METLFVIDDISEEVTLFGEKFFSRKETILNVCTQKMSISVLFDLKTISYQFES